MYLREILSNKKIVDLKIKEIEELLYKAPSKDIESKLFSLFEEKQNLLISIDTANSLSKINIGGADTTISSAVRLRNTIKMKIDVLTKLIMDDECSLDKLKLQSQRDKYYEDYTLLTMAIDKNDLTVELN